MVNMEIHVCRDERKKNQCVSIRDEIQRKLKVNVTDIVHIHISHVRWFV